MDRFVEVLRAPDRQTLEEPRSILESEGILARIDVETAANLWGGVGAVFGGARLVVPAGSVERARQLLCEHEVKCEVPQDAVDRLVRRVFEPALAGVLEEDRVLGLLENQTRDFRLAVFSRVQARPGGIELLERLLAASVATDAGGEDVRRDVSHALQGADPEALAGTLAAGLIRSGDPGVRVRLARALGRFRNRFAAEHLVALLQDADPDVREEAYESLYFLSGGRGFGFDPRGTAMARAAAVVAWIEWLGTLATVFG
jgi:hypothetical protein